MGEERSIRSGRAERVCNGDHLVYVFIEAERLHQELFPET
jgi:hypothetical protein